MRNLAYILISAFCLVCFCSCSVGERLQAMIEKKRLNDEFEFSLDSIRKIASAYKDDHAAHNYEVCNWRKRQTPSYETPSYVLFSGANGGDYIHLSNGDIIKNREEDDTCFYEREVCVYCLLFWGEIKYPQANILGSQGRWADLN